MTMGQRIKALREAKGMTMEELAKRIGKSRVTLYRYENGPDAKISTEVLGLLAINLDTNVANLLGWTPDDDATKTKMLASQLDDETWSAWAPTADGSVMGMGMYFKNDNKSQIIMFNAETKKVERLSFDKKSFATMELLAHQLKTEEKTSE